jgi:hypothetical protein
VALCVPVVNLYLAIGAYLVGVSPNARE